MLTQPRVHRQRTRAVQVGKVAVGGGAPVSVQSMTITDTRDVEGTLVQIYQLAAEGCEIVRLAVPDREAAEALTGIKSRSPLPIVADIHFDHRLALLALEAGVDKLRINPGNIGSRERTRIVARAAKERGVPIRIGANIGSPSKGRRRRSVDARREGYIHLVGFVLLIALLIILTVRDLGRL